MSSDTIDEIKLSYYYAGKVLTRNEIHLQEPMFQQALQRSLFSPTSSILHYLFYSECQRCSNRKRSLFGLIPCPRCRKKHLYCRKCITMGRIMACEPLYYWSGRAPEWTKFVQPCEWKGQLTELQQAAANRIVKAIQKKERELLVWAVCGSGKTEMLFPGLTEALQIGYRVCIATPRTDVVKELLPRLQQAFPFVPMQALYGDSLDKVGTAQLILATTHQLLRYKQAFDVLIIDELDAFPFHTDPALPFAAKRAQKKQHTTIYLTATPRQNLQTKVKNGKLPHLFVPVRFHGHPLPVPSPQICYSLKKTLQHAALPAAFTSWINERQNSNRQLLVFVPTIELADRLISNLTTLLLKQEVIQTKQAVAVVHSKDSYRSNKVKAFRKKELYALVTTTILERGVTFPSIDVAVLQADHDVFDAAALVQIAGRAGRSPKDPTGEVVFFHQGKTNAIVHAIQSIRAMNKRGGFLIK